ncbi:MAG: polyketide synthase, partial [Gammaproteobacteria bacterium]|nr:polyketide synthase [Gammaproteobacteria bacterium]
MSSQSRDKIAIIGIAGRFPGAPDVETFWDNLQQGVNSIREVPSERWDVNQYYSPDMKRPNTSNSKWCGIVDGVDQFDHRFFNISAREANNMDPQQRMLLQETWHCIEDAGVNPKQLSEQTTGVYVGVMANDYGQEAAHPERTVDPYAGLGNYANVLSNRLSYFLGTHGPSSTINAACASSLVAIHEAKRALQSGECRYALAAGVNLNLTPWKHISFGRSRMLSPDGQCKTFDAEANGYVPGDGVAVVLMQSLSEALAEGNPIYGVVRASAINHNGLNASITAPNVEAQQRLIESCYREAGFSPETVGYIEAHGTGTSLGDPIEVEALTRAFSGYTDKQGFCHIGSVKSNIGHLEGAA